MRLGVAYYPDYIFPAASIRRSDKNQCEASVNSQIISDLERMRKLGLEIIRIGEFSWAHVEPNPGILNFDRFRFTLDRAKDFGISAILCTPTATPPKWLTDKYPEVLPVDRSGKKIPFGGRRHYDPVNEIIRSESRRITTQFAQNLGNHQAVIGWQTDNEIGNHSSWQSFTDASLSQFRSWLRRRYENDISALNEAWFTCFWSMNFRDFDEVDLPVATWTAPNPHLELDFRRFMSDMNIRFQKDQIDIIKKLSPGRFITHNLTPMFFEIDLWRFCADLDVVGYDHYQMESEPNPVSSSSQFSLMRSLGREKPFMVLEQQPVQVNWQQVNRRYQMDWLLLWGAQAAFQGAESMLYFSWRRFAGGSEQFHDAIISHDARIPETRQEKVIKAKLSMFQSFREYFRIDTLPSPTPQILILHDPESIWAHENPRQSSNFKPIEAIESIQKLFMSRGYSVSMTPSLIHTDLAKYALVIIPGHAFTLSSLEIAALSAYLVDGGKALSLPRSCFKDRHGQMVDYPLELFGRNEFYFDDFGALSNTEIEDVVPLDCGLQQLNGNLWSEKIILGNDSPWKEKALFRGGLYAGAPAAISREVGNGRHLHLAFWPTLGDVAIDFIVRSLGISPNWALPTNQDIQIFPLAGKHRKFIGIINFTQISQPVRYLKDQIRCLNGIIMNLNDNLQISRQVLSLDLEKVKLWDIPSRSVGLFECLPSKSKN